MDRMSEVLRRIVLAAISILSILWLVDAPVHLGMPLIAEQFYLVIAGLAVAAGFLSKPYGKSAGWLEAALALAALAAWGWAAWWYGEWLIGTGGRAPWKWLPGAAALLLLLEATRRNCGAAIAALMATVGLYGFVGHLLPGVFEAEYTAAPRLILYLYADSNGVPGLVLGVATTVVLAFIVFSKCLELSGAGQFFDNLSMALLGNRRGGPAKVAVVSSSLFGIISGSSVANVVSSGIVTIPLMKRYGVKPSFAGAVEAVSSNAGQFTPPVMGATAFLIAEFLQIPYSEVVLAAAVPAFIFYVVLFLQVDSHAARNGLAGVPRAQLPRLGRVLAAGWIFLVPIALLVWLMFWQGINVSKAALYAAGAMLVLGIAQRWRLPRADFLRALAVGVGEDMLQILLVSAAAGIVIGVLNISGLSFTITLALTQVGQNAGPVAMISLTALIAIVLGMGMPTAAVYVLLSVVLAPALVKMGIEPLAAHMFIFYFGLMSMLTPPVAMASYAAASLANADLWKTSLDALRLGISGYLLPFIFVLNPALLLHGTPLAIALATATALLSGAWIAWSTEGSIGARPLNGMLRSALLLASLPLGSATLWLGSDSLLNCVVLLAGAALTWLVYALASRSAIPSSLVANTGRVK
ncbi:MAG TPA: TRAP transporter fused permease subunit [Alphaproteobacteria bacterium]|nr:TRAP transporter fused permease subunit [Alphaproteobacteria bacterium]